MPIRLFKPLMLLLILLMTLAVSLTPVSLAQPAPQQSNPSQFPTLVNTPPAYAGDYFHLQKKIYRWSDQTKFVLVHISTASYLPNWQPWNPQIIKDAFGEWQRALNNRIMFVFMDESTNTKEHSFMPWVGV